MSAGKDAQLSPIAVIKPVIEPVIKPRDTMKGSFHIIPHGWIMVAENCSNERSTNQKRKPTRTICTK